MSDHDRPQHIAELAARRDHGRLRIAWIVVRDIGHPQILAKFEGPNAETHARHFAAHLNSGVPPHETPDQLID